jgi:hypothetical protein
MIPVRTKCSVSKPLVRILTAMASTPPSSISLGLKATFLPLMVCSSVDNNPTGTWITPSSANRLMSAGTCAAILSVKVVDLETFFSSLKTLTESPTDKPGWLEPFWTQGGSISSSPPKDSSSSSFAAAFSFPFRPFSFSCSAANRTLFSGLVALDLCVPPTSTPPSAVPPIQVAASAAPSTAVPPSAPSSVSVSPFLRFLEVWIPFVGLTRGSSSELTSDQGALAPPALDLV